MTLNDYNRFCRSLPATTHVVQWGGAHVWKVAAKVFAIGRENDTEVHITFKCSAMSYNLLKDLPGCRPAPYLASRGMTWIQRTSAETLDDTGMKDYLRASYDLVAAGLPKRIREALRLTGNHLINGDTCGSPATKTAANAAPRRAAKRKGATQ
ncbi:MAG: MmcQ/YjbR family DNA-binding protein [Hyphomicrobiaceae bacterium]